MMSPCFLRSEDARERDAHFRKRCCEFGGRLHARPSDIAVHLPISAPSTFTSHMPSFSLGDAISRAVLEREARRFAAERVNKSQHGEESETSSVISCGSSSMVSAPFFRTKPSKLKLGLVHVEGLPVPRRAGRSRSGKRQASARLSRADEKRSHRQDDCHEEGGTCGQPAESSMSGNSTPRMTESLICEQLLSVLYPVSRPVHCLANYASAFFVACSSAPASLAPAAATASVTMPCIRSPATDAGEPASTITALHEAASSHLHQRHTGGGAKQQRCNEAAAAPVAARAAMCCSCVADGQSLTVL